MEKKKSSGKTILLLIGIALIAIGPILLIVGPMQASSYGYDMFNTSSSISASDPHFSEVSSAIMSWWSGLGLSIFGIPIGIILIVLSRKNNDGKRA